MQGVTGSNPVSSDNAPSLNFEGEETFLLGHRAFFLQIRHDGNVFIYWREYFAEVRNPRFVELVEQPKSSLTGRSRHHN